MEVQEVLEKVNNILGIVGYKYIHEVIQDRNQT